MVKSELSCSTKQKNLNNYFPIPLESSEKLLDNDDDETSSIQEKILGEEARQKKRNSQKFAYTVSHTILLIISASLFAASFFPKKSGVFSVSVQTNARSSLEDLVEEYVPLRFEADMDTTATPYRGPPSPSVDAAWAELVEDKFMVVPQEDLHGQNVSSHNPLHASNLIGKGILAKFEVYHGLHCVHHLWKHTYPEYYVRDRETFLRHPEREHAHLDHCADLLRQMILCNADFSIHTFYLSSGIDEPLGDFNVIHQCQNLDSVQKYAAKHRFDAWTINENEELKAHRTKILAEKFPL